MAVPKVTESCLAAFAGQDRTGNTSKAAIRRNNLSHRGPWSTLVVENAIQAA
jgi:hypothetical protein